MDELLDIVDQNDRPTGLTKSKSAIHADGDYHRASHMWIRNDQGEILFQLRSLTKDLFPGLWDITGGHVAAGESYVEAAVRELDEELGIRTIPSDLETLFRQRDPVVGREFQQVFLLRTNEPIDGMTLQVEQVQEARYYTVGDLRHRLHSEGARKAFCPVVDYYLKMLDIIEAKF